MKTTYTDKLSLGSIIRFHGISLFLGLMPFFLVLAILGAIFGIPFYFNGAQVSSLHALYALPLFGLVFCLVLLIGSTINSLIGFFVLSLMKKQYEIEYLEGKPPVKIGEEE